MHLHRKVALFFLLLNPSDLIFVRANFHTHRWFDWLQMAAIDE